MDLIEQRLPGRTDDEERALRDVVHDVETTQRRRSAELGKPAPETPRGMSGRMERMNAHQLSLDEAMAALAAQLDELAAARLALLPADATEIRLGDVPQGVQDDRRHPVVCTSGGETVSLGGCSRIGAAEDRLRWFREAAERRRSQ